MAALPPLSGQCVPDSDPSGKGGSVQVNSRGDGLHLAGVSARITSFLLCFFLFFSLPGWTTTCLSRCSWVGPHRLTATLCAPVTGLVVCVDVRTDGVDASDAVKRKLKDLGASCQQTPGRRCTHLVRCS